MRWIYAFLLTFLAVPAFAADPYFLRPLTTQAFPFDGTSRPITNALGPTTDFIRVACTTSCYVSVGANPFVSTTTGMYLPADNPEYIVAKRGEKIAVIRSTNSGTIYVTEMSR